MLHVMGGPIWQCEDGKQRKRTILNAGGYEEGDSVGASKAVSYLKGQAYFSGKAPLIDESWLDPEVEFNSGAETFQSVVQI
jgi:hypothetical protein